jgi:hypothetical protein
MVDSWKGWHLDVAFCNITLLSLHSKKLEKQHWMSFQRFTHFSQKLAFSIKNELFRILFVSAFQLEKSIRFQHWILFASMVDVKVSIF